MSEQEFWRSTPVMFFKRLERFRNQLKKDDYRVGLVCSVLANIHRDRKKRPKPFLPADFVPGEKKSDGKATKWQDQLRLVQHLNMLFGGSDIRGKKEN